MKEAECTVRAQLEFHNPGNLTPDQYGASAGWRLFLPYERVEAGDERLNSKGHWQGCAVFGFSPMQDRSQLTYRTKRPLPQKGGQPCPPSNTSSSTTHAPAADGSVMLQGAQPTGGSEAGDESPNPSSSGECCDVLSLLRTANIERQKEWCPDQLPDLSFRGNELAGETGEACNVIKKIERERHGWRGSRANVDQLAEELADVVIVADLIATQCGIDLSKAVIDKFNATSDKNRISVRISDKRERTVKSCETRATSTNSDVNATAAQAATLASNAAPSDVRSADEPQSIRQDHQSWCASRKIGGGACSCGAGALKCEVCGKAATEVTGGEDNWRPFISSARCDEHSFGENTKPPKEEPQISEAAKQAAVLLEKWKAGYFFLVPEHCVQTAINAATAQLKDRVRELTNTESFLSGQVQNVELQRRIAAGPGTPFDSEQN